MAIGIKTGGRTKGAVNKTTSETKKLLQKIVSNELDNLTDLLSKLEPKERIDAVIKLLPYIVPRQSEITTPIDEQPRKILIKINRREEQDNFLTVQK
jgi:hypothetical protein